MPLGESFKKFHNKDDIRPLPPIPKNLNEEMKKLQDTINKNDLNNFDRLKHVYDFMDKFGEFVSTFSVCQKGCSFCCKIDVQVSRLEAEYISLKGGYRLDSGNDQTFMNEKSCPFLGKDQCCSIYAYRPFNCRTFHTLDDPKYCSNGDEKHQIYGSASQGYGVGIYRGIAGWLKGIHEEKKIPYRDIRALLEIHG